MATVRITPVKTLTPVQVAWLKSNAVEYGTHPDIVGYWFRKGDYSVEFIPSLYGEGGYSIETPDRSEDGDGARTVAWDLSLRDALKMLVEVAS